MRRRALTVLAALAVLMVWAVPATAAPPERIEAPILRVFPDPVNRLVVFVNITRDDYCAWAADEFEGDPPVARLITVQEKETGQGALVGSFRGEVPIELWQADDDVPPFVDPCEDTDDQPGPWATGTGRFGANDNDIDASLTRTNSFGGRLVATVTDVDGGTWRYLATARFQITRDDEFVVRAEHFNLVRQGR